MRKYKIANLVGLVLLVVSIIQVLGLKTFFAGCSKRDNGSWMNCRWATQAVIGVSLLLIVMAVMLILVRSTNTKKGIALAMIPTALLNILLPGYLIPLCTSTSMRCHTTMLPAVRIMSLIIAGIALVEVLGLLFAGRRERKQMEAAMEAGSHAEEALPQEEVPAIADAPQEMPQEPAREIPQETSQEPAEESPKEPSAGQEA